MRALAATLLVLFGASACAQQPPLTARQVIGRIQSAIPAPPPAGTVDTIKAGDPNENVTGIVTCFTDSMDVLRQAVALHANLIVTHEPTFYNHRDETAALASDPVYREKLAYIDQHHLVVWRFHDQWHLRRPDGILEGFVDEVGWRAYERADQPYLFRLPPTTVSELATELQRRLQAGVVRVVGDPALRVTGVAYAPGASGEEKQIRALERDDVQALVAGEAAEWEAVMYTQDAVEQHRPKALILVGHSVSESAGMRTAAAWLAALLPGIPVHFVDSGEPYWPAGRPPR